MDALIQDLRYAFRTLWASKSFAAVAVIALALGIGANSALFSVVNGVLLRPLPFPEPDRLVIITNSTSEQRDGSQAPADYLDLRQLDRAFAVVAAFRQELFTLTERGEPQQLAGYLVTSNFFDVFRVNARLGRVFDRRDEPARPPIVVLSHALWQSRFGSDPNIVGQSVHLGGTSYQAVGVMPQGFAWPPKAEIWVLAPRIVPDSPVELDGDLASNREIQFLNVAARLKPGIPLSAAQAEASALGTRLERQFPASSSRAFHLIPMHDFLVSDVRTVLMVLLSAVGFVLLIACTNVANLMLARAARRQREIGIRTALGAGRLRLMRQLLTESLVLSMAGGIAGLLVALWGTDLFITLSPDNLPRLDEVRLDAGVVTFTVLVSLATGVLFGLAPALQASSVNLTDSLKEGTSGAGSGRRRRRTQNLLVVAEFALSMMLVTGAGLMARSFLKLREVDPGFAPAAIMSVDIALPQTQYRESQKTIALYDRLLERFSSSPAGGPIALAFPLPLAGNGSGSATFLIEGRPVPERRSRPAAAFNVVSPGYFRVMAVPLVRGRDFGAQDVDGTSPVVMISRTMADRYWPNADPIGQRINLGDENDPKSWNTIIGVVGDVRPAALSQPPGPEVYLTYRQLPFPYLTAVVRTSAPASSVRAAFRNALNDIDKDFPLGDVKRMDDIVSTSVAQPKFRTLLLSAFALLAVILAAVGIYGLMNYSVTRRTRELGIRVALGADRGDVLRLILVDGLRLAAAGVVLGLLGTFILGRLITSLLFGVTATDPWTFATVSTLLVAVGLAASYFPARRAMRVDPLMALRSE